MTTVMNAPVQDFQTFLEEHLDRDLLRFTTAGSVDDGKSTLIGRLLHDTKSVYEDQLKAVENARVNRAGNDAKGAKRIDLSLLTDGLKAEREQGITIDVAYRYFATSKRKFIIADTPGHEQYTRNMATGASTADVAIVLIDGSKGLLPQSRRHTFIASLLNIPHVVAAVNKMDLVQYSEARFREIEKDFHALASKLGLKSVQMIPLSALEGDNVVNHGVNTPWYKGPTLLDYLETVPVHVDDLALPLRFPVQLVQRPDRTFRGFSGTVASGKVAAGQKVTALPSGRSTTVKRIVTWDGDWKEAVAGDSVTLELNDEIDLSRGEMLIATSENAAPHASTRFSAKVVWMHEEPLVPGRSYLAKQTTRTVRTTVSEIAYRVDVNTLEHAHTDSLKMNDIAAVQFTTSLPIFFDSYGKNRATGAMILIDPITNATVGAAMIDEPLGADTAAETKRSLFAHLPDEHATAQQLAQELENAGYAVALLDDEHVPAAQMAVAVRAVQLAGGVAITSAQLDEATLAAIRSFSPVPALNPALPLARLISTLLEEKA